MNKKEAVRKIFTPRVPLYSEDTHSLLPNRSNEDLGRLRRDDEEAGTESPTMRMPLYSEDTHALLSNRSNGDLGRDEKEDQTKEKVTDIINEAGMHQESKEESSHRHPPRVFLQEIDDCYLARFELSNAVPREIGVRIGPDTLEVYTEPITHNPAAPPSASEQQVERISSPTVEIVQASNTALDPCYHNRVVTVQEMHKDDITISTNKALNGDIHYSFPLPSNADINKCNCSYSEGIVSIKIYKSKMKYLCLSCR